MMVLTNSQRTRFLRQAVADLYVANGGTDSGGDVGQFIADPRVAREARIAITMAARGQLGGGDADEEGGPLMTLKSSSVARATARG
jgi:hypothetical protein